MILIISIPKARERMLPTTPPLSYPPPPPLLPSLLVKNLKFNVSIFITRFASKRYRMLRSTIICFCFPCKYSLCSYYSCVLPGSMSKLISQFKIPYRPYRPSITLVLRNSFPTRTSTVCPISPNPQIMALNGFA